MTSYEVLVAGVADEQDEFEDEELDDPPADPIATAAPTITAATTRVRPRVNLWRVMLLMSAVATAIRSVSGITTGVLRPIRLSPTMVDA